MTRSELEAVEELLGQIEDQLTLAVRDVLRLRSKINEELDKFDEPKNSVA